MSNTLAAVQRLVQSDYLNVIVYHEKEGAEYKPTFKKFIAFPAGLGITPFPPPKLQEICAYNLLLAMLSYIILLVSLIIVIRPQLHSNIFYTHFYSLISIPVYIT